MKLKTVILKDRTNEVGYDEFNQLTHSTTENGRTTFTPIADVRGETCFLCKRKWPMDCCSEFIDQHRYGVLDKWVHMTCYVGYLSMNDASLLYSALSAARLRWHTPEPIPNRYGADFNEDWYAVKIRDLHATLTFGRRRRVWNIEVATDFDLDEGAAGQALSRDVTKSFSKRHMMIHAYSEAEVHEYIKAFADRIHEDAAKVGFVYKDSHA